MGRRRSRSRVSRTPSSSPDRRLHREESGRHGKLKRSKSDHKRKKEHKHTESRKKHKDKHKGKDHHHHHHHRKSSSKKKTKKRSNRRKDHRDSDSDSNSSSYTSSENDSIRGRRGRSRSRSPSSKRSRKHSHSRSRSFSNENYKEGNKRLRMSENTGKRSQNHRHTSYSSDEDPKIDEPNCTPDKFIAEDTKVSKTSQIHDTLMAEDFKVEKQKQSRDILLEESMVDSLQATNEEVAQTLSRDMEQVRGSTEIVEADLELELRQKALANLMRHRNGSIKLNRSEVSSLSNTCLKDTNAGGDVDNHNVDSAGSQSVCNASIESDLPNNQPLLTDDSCKYMTGKALENHSNSPDGLISKPSEYEINKAIITDNDEGIKVLNSSPMEENTINLCEGEPNLYGKVDHLIDSNAQWTEHVKENETGVTGIITTKNIHLQFNQGSESTHPQVEKADSSLTEERAQSVHSNTGDGQIETLSTNNSLSKDTNCTSKPEVAISQEREDGSSVFQQKTMSVMRGGELVQVSYKVYIPQRAVELARRRLQR